MLPVQPPQGPENPGLCGAVAVLSPTSRHSQPSLRRRSRTFVSLHRLFVVILMTLGLQVPGGLTFRVCLCNGVFGGSASHPHGCPSVDEGRCCDDHAPAESAERIERAGKEVCRCVLVSMPTQPAAKVLPNGLSLAVLPLRTFAQIVRIPELGMQTREWARARAHDPPWERANVPLRI